MKSFQLLIFSIISILFVHCKTYEKLSFKENIQPVNKNSGFRMEGYWVWGGSMIKVDDMYHLFASRWKKDNHFPEGYRTNSEIVRATAKNPLGPFTFSEVVISERDSIYWDSNMAHNPTIHQIGDEFVLFYIGSDFTTMRKESRYLLRRVGYASSKSIKGPWQRSDQPIIDKESNNPAILVDDEKILLMYRDAPLRTYLVYSDNYKGPYTLINENIWPEHKIEDFYLFKSKESYHLICEDNVGGISGHERWGVHLASEDGIKKWEKYEPVVVYDHDLLYQDGTVLNCVRRERPQLLIQKNKVTHIITGIYDGENSWCQPVELIPKIRLKN